MASAAAGQGRFAEIAVKWQESESSSGPSEEGSEQVPELSCGEEMSGLCKGGSASYAREVRPRTPSPSPSLSHSSLAKPVEGETGGREKGVTESLMNFRRGRWTEREREGEEGRVRGRDNDGDGRGEGTKKEGTMSESNPMGIQGIGDSSAFADIHSLPPPPLLIPLHGSSTYRSPQDDQPAGNMDGSFLRHASVFPPAGLFPAHVTLPWVCPPLNHLFPGGESTGMPPALTCPVMWAHEGGGLGHVSGFMGGERRQQQMVRRMCRWWQCKQKRRMRLWKQRQQQQQQDIAGASKGHQVS